MIRAPFVMCARHGRRMSEYEEEEYDSMGISELQATLDEQQKLLADMEEQLTFLLRSTGHHIGGVYRRKREAQVDKQRALVALLRANLDHTSNLEPCE